MQPEELATPFLERLEAQSGDKFRGKARKAAKLAIATAPVEDFADLKDLLDSLPADADMIAHTPPITVKELITKEDKFDVRFPLDFCRFSFR